MSPAGAPPVVILSLADTLVSLRPRVRDCIQEIRDTVARHAPQEVPSTLDPTGPVTRAGPVRVGGLAQTVRELADTASFPLSLRQALVDIVHRHWRAPARIRSGAQRFLRELRADGVRLGLIDAGDVVLLRSVLHQTDLVKAFDVTHLGLRRSSLEVDMVRALLATGKQPAVLVGSWPELQVDRVTIAPFDPDSETFDSLKIRIGRIVGQAPANR